MVNGLIRNLEAKKKEKQFAEYAEQEGIEEDIKAGQMSDYKPEADTLVCRFSKDYVISYDSDRFAEVNRKKFYKDLDGKGEYITTTTLATENISQEIRGLKSIRIFQKEVSLEFSSKVLGCNYRELLNWSNLRRAIERICATGLIFLDIDMVLSNGWVTQIDVTRNMQMGGETNVKNMISFLVMLAGARYWNCEPYKTSGIIFSRDVKTKQLKERLKVYHKMTQVPKKLDGDLPAYNYVVSNGLEDDCAGDARWEVSLRRKKKILQRLGIKDRKLSTVFNATQCPILAMFEDIVKNANIKIKKEIRGQERTALELYSKLNMSKMTLKKRSDYLMATTLIAYHKGNIKAIRADLKTSIDAGQVSKFLRKHIIPEINRSKNEILKTKLGENFSISSRIEVIRGLLKEAS
jgi:hypothetical protein